MKTYKDKLISAEDAVKLVKSGDHIVTGLGASEGREFLSKLHLVGDRVENVSFSNCLPMTKFEFFDEKYKYAFNLDGWFFAPSLRKAFNNGNTSYIPNHLHTAGSARFGHKKPNIYVGSCTPVDEHGFVSLSMGNTYERLAIDLADIVILEPNKNFPRTFGDVEVHIDEVDYFIEADYMPPTIPNVEPNEKDMKIGKIIADLIPDGAVIQLGIGGIPNAVAKFLYDKKDLGIHTEMLTSEMARLAKAGVINGRKKTLNPRKIVTTFILGDEELYEFVNNNPSVQVMNGGYTNNPYIIAQNDNMFSINTAVEIDLTGQVCSESIGPKQISGTGGQADTARGAVESNGGRSIIALYSTQDIKDKETGEVKVVSKIGAILTPGAAVTLHRSDVDLVVTEYGVADLKGTTLRERVQRLTAIAHPDFREQLKEDALKLGIVGEWR
ncbi:MAG: 4-hydroxybutyrate--acetyl-CoA CoA transferase [Tissierellia bacterium]|nr:4-hydroxybutyrate--acetyl-CoA CoA transferase [Tissierellia bacterium]